MNPGLRLAGISRHRGSAPTLVAAWEFLEGSGSSVADSSTFAPNSLTLTNETWLGATSPLTNAVSFAGTGGAESANHTNTNFTNTEPFSVSVWFKTADTTDQMILAGTLNPSSNYAGWEISLNTFSHASNISVALINTYPSNWILVYTPFSASTLYNLVFTYDGSDSSAGVNVYLNGSPVSTTTGFNSLSASIASNTNVFIAERSDNSAQYTGDVGPLYIWKRVLTALEISTLYSNPYSPPA